MYIAHFEINKREPERMYFTASEKETKIMEFSAEDKRTIKFKITKDMNLEVE